MKLQKLELTGFKSFPDRADVAFDYGVTAIVGPNGCGKSNIVDAITWVLGEQSARSLRGERMEDVIFSGSDARKATGAAEVRLHLRGVVTRRPSHDDNGHGNGHGSGNGGGNANGEGGGAPDAYGALEGNGNGHSHVEALARDVEVGRRLYRSGESEYLIDGHTCRLRDVQDLLMDVGVGVKGYAVIEQGKIGQILSAKPTDRRQLIEEAAGVTKFKARRRAAELKLEAAQQNLTRVDDLIAELDRQRAALKRQAAKARRYGRLRAELRRWEKLLFADRYQELSEAIRRTRQRLTDTREREAAAAAELAEQESHLARLRIELAEADARANQLRSEAHTRELENERRQQQIVFDTQQAASLAIAAQEKLAELQALEARLAPGRQELEARRLGASEAAGERERAAAVLAAEEAALQTAERVIGARETDVESTRHTLYTNLQSAATLQHAIERAEEGRRRLADELARLDVEAGDLRIEIQRVTRVRDQVLSDLQSARSALAETTTARSAAASELAAVQIERDAKTLEARNLETEITAMAARLQSLEELEATRAAYGEAARLLLSTAETGVAHRGSVADCLDVEPGFERAVEAALGDLLQAIVVEQAADAERGLSFVRGRNAGRCAFLVCGSRLQPGVSTARAASAPASSTPTSTAISLRDVVRVSGDHADRVRWAMGDVWIADGYDIALRLSSAIPVPVVSRAGELFRGGVLITGGARGESRGILLNKREQRELSDCLAAHRATLEGLRAELQEREAKLVSIQERITGLDVERHDRDKAILQGELHASRAAEDLGRLDRRHAQNDAERSRYEDERRLLDERAAEAQEAATRLAAERGDAEGRLSATQQDLIAARSALADVSRRVSEANAAWAALVERAAAAANDVARLEHAACDLDARITASRDERARNERQRADLERGVEESRRQLDQDLGRFEALRVEVSACDERAAALEMQFQGIERNVRQSRVELDTVRAEAAQHDVACATAESDLSHLAVTCADTLQMTLDQVAAEVVRVRAEEVSAPASDALDDEGDDQADDAEPASSVESQSNQAGQTSDDASAPGSGQELAAGAAPLTAEDAIARLKARIDRLGPVNMMAIEQFDELETRHGFLTTQRTDLLESISQTGQAIKRIEKTTRERFHEAFGTINTYFGETFATLFGGGRAGLVMLDEQDELESGIDIIAQPPGKRLQNVQLLSGGEKALTAMALMFALFRYRPSPFCLLDEIDAPLDDANVARFVDMLRSMQEQTQFILITHHRKTMEIADRLYGVTMEEPGVSKLISIQLGG